MIVAILASLIGLAVITTALHRLTLSALPVFAGLSAGFFALDHGVGIGTAAAIALGVGVFAHAVFQTLAEPQMPLPIRLIAKVSFAIPAAAVAWFMIFGLMASSDGDPIVASILATLGALFIAAQAWVSFEPGD